MWERQGGVLPGREVLPERDSTRADGQRKPIVISILESHTFEMEGYPLQEAPRQLGEKLRSFKMSQDPEYDYRVKNSLESYCSEE